MLNYVIVYISSSACYSVYFPTNQSQPLINQLQSNSYSPLIGSFKFQALSLVKTQKRTSSHTREREHPVFTLIGQSKTALAFPSTNHRQTKTIVAKSIAPNNPTSSSSSTLSSHYIRLH